MRRMIATIFLLGSSVTVMELILIGHTEDLWQWVPLLLLPVSILLFILQSLLRSVAMISMFRTMMLLCLISGLVGIGLHYKAKVEFKLETNPTLAGWELVSEAIRGSTLPPVLAPGMMIQIGLLGWASTLQEPILQKREK